MLYLLGGVCGALSSAAMHSGAFEGVGASGAVYALEACNCLLQPQRQYVWGGMVLSSVQLLAGRLCLDLMAHMQGSRVDYAAHLGGVAAGGAYWGWLQHLKSSAYRWL